MQRKRNKNKRGVIFSSTTEISFTAENCKITVRNIMKDYIVLNIILAHKTIF